MSVRLAFAVVAHVSADILVIDEALAVGDAFFTQKCMRFIERHREESSLLFVSHDASAVSSLCDKALLLRQGRQVMIGKPKTVIDQYTKDMYESVQDVNSPSNRTIATDTEPICDSVTTEQSDWIDYRTSTINTSSAANIIEITQFKECLSSAESFGNGKAQIKDVKLLESNTRRPILAGRGGERVILRIDALAIKQIRNPIVGFLLKNEKGQILFGDNSLNSISNLLHKDNSHEISERSCYAAEFEFTLPLLQKGSYGFTIALGELSKHEILQWMNGTLCLNLSTSVAAGLKIFPCIALLPSHLILNKFDYHYCIIPKYMGPSAWWQHVPIAHWLVSELKPNKVVELGSHYGVSFSLFARLLNWYRQIHLSMQ